MKNLKEISIELGKGKDCFVYAKERHEEGIVSFYANHEAQYHWRRKDVSYELLEHPVNDWKNAFWGERDWHNGDQIIEEWKVVIASHIRIVSKAGLKEELVEVCNKVLGKRNEARMLRGDQMLMVIEVGEEYFAKKLLHPNNERN